MKIKNFCTAKDTKNQMLLAYACNPNYLGGWDQEDCGSRPVRAKSSWDSISNSWVQWAHAVILDIQEAKIGKTAVSGQPKQNVCETPFQQKKFPCGGTHTCHPSYSKKHETGGPWSRTTGQKARPYLQNNWTKELEAWLKQQSTCLGGVKLRSITSPHKKRHC
jgi:hypothetical protein